MMVLHLQQAHSLAIYQMAQKERERKTGFSPHIMIRGDGSIPPAEMKGRKTEGIERMESYQGLI